MDSRKYFAGKVSVFISLSIIVLYIAAGGVCAVSTNSLVQKIYSPRQIDRVPVQEEKFIQAMADIKNLMVVKDEDIVKAMQELVGKRHSSKLLESFRKQVNDWVAEKKAGKEVRYEFPLSPKQFAWALYILYPGKYINPKEDPDIYPELHKEVATSEAKP